MVVPGSGRALRQFLYSRDLARILIWALRNYDEVEPFIISVDPNQEMSIKDAVTMVSESSGFEGVIQWDTNATDGQLEKPQTILEYELFLEISSSQLWSKVGNFPNLAKLVHLLKSIYRIERDPDLVQCEPRTYRWHEPSKR